MPKLSRRPLLLTDDAAVRNLCQIEGRLQERGALRYTPAGIPVVEFRLSHQSEQAEAGGLRQVDCELPCVALGQTANLLKDVAAGQALSVSGFLAAKSLKNRSLVLHIITIEFKEGSHHGI